MKHFESIYPIICAPMNQVSDLELALAVNRAGAMPGIMRYCYKTKNDFFDAIEKFVSITNSSNIIIALDDRDIIHPLTIKKIIDLKISHVMRYPNEDPSLTENQKITAYKAATKILGTLPCKTIELFLKKDFYVSESSIYFLKGSDGAGRGVVPTEELFDHYKERYPNASFVPVGGISCSNDVQKYLDKGAVAVAVGTMFAASKESCLSEEAKEKIVHSSSKNLVRLTEEKNQQSIIFSRIPEDDKNNTESLKLGIKSGQVGHLFLGKAVDSIDRIRTVEETVQYLIKDLT
jgi:hypothetical protein